MTMQLRNLQAKGTFDEGRDRPALCLCLRRVTGRCHALSAASCPFDQPRPRVVGRWGVVWACPDQGEWSE